MAAVAFPPVSIPAIPFTKTAKTEQEFLEIQHWPKDQPFPLQDRFYACATDAVFGPQAPEMEKAFYSLLKTAAVMNEGAHSFSDKQVEEAMGEFVKNLKIIEEKAPSNIRYAIDKTLTLLLALQPDQRKWGPPQNSLESFCRQKRDAVIKANPDAPCVFKSSEELNLLPNPPPSATLPERLSERPNKMEGRPSFFSTAFKAALAIFLGYHGFSWLASGIVASGKSLVPDPLNNSLRPKGVPSAPLSTFNAPVLQALLANHNITLTQESLGQNCDLLRREFLVSNPNPDVIKFLQSKADWSWKVYSSLVETSLKENRYELLDWAIDHQLIKNDSILPYFQAKLWRQFNKPDSTLDPLRAVGIMKRLGFEANKNVEEFPKPPKEYDSWNKVPNCVVKA